MLSAEPEPESAATGLAEPEGNQLHINKAIRTFHLYSYDFSVS